MRFQLLQLECQKINIRLIPSALYLRIHYHLIPKTMTSRHKYTRELLQCQKVDKLPLLHFFFLILPNDSNFGCSTNFPLICTTVSSHFF